jgi:hypothetical protein
LTPLLISRINVQDFSMARTDPRHLRHDVKGAVNPFLAPKGP